MVLCIRTSARSRRWFSAKTTASSTECVLVRGVCVTKVGRVTTALLSTVMTFQTVSVTVSVLAPTNVVATQGGTDALVRQAPVLASARVWSVHVARVVVGAMLLNSVFLVLKQDRTPKISVQTGFTTSV